MQFASQGFRFLSRKATSAASHGQSQAASGIAHHSNKVHLPSSTTTSGVSHGFHAQASLPSSSASSPSAGGVQKLFTHSKHIASRLFAHLATPGIPAPLPRTFNPSIPPRVSVQQSIQNGFSLPVRYALRNPSLLHQRTFLPKPPVIPPRSIAEVGLGTARRFHTSRPMFQNLVENVPIVARAFYEADWEVKMQKEQEMMKFKMLREKREKKAKSKAMSKPRESVNKIKQVAVAPATTTTEVPEELDTYFPTPVAQVITYLLVPLAPTPTNRTPLQTNPAASTAPPSLLPLAQLATTQISNEMHSLRVHALFTRLDAARVWDKGVKCSSYSHLLAPHSAGDGGGICNMLKLEFVGWTKEDVLAVIGDSGKGWCVLEEVRSALQEDDEDSILADDDSLSEASFATGTSAEWDAYTQEQRTATVDPAQTLVMPSLDLSPVALSATLHAQITPLSFSPTSESDFDPWVQMSSPSSGRRGSASPPALSSPRSEALSSLPSDWDSTSDWEFSRVSSPIPSEPEIVASASGRRGLRVERINMNLDTLTASAGGLGFSSEFVSRSGLADGWF